MSDTELRVNAMAAEYRATITALTERCVQLSVANALASGRIQELEAALRKYEPKPDGKTKPKLVK